MMSEALRQPSVDLAHLFPVDGGGQAVIVSAAEPRSHPHLIHPKHLRILLGQPVRSGSGGRGKNHADPVLIESVNDP